MTTQTALIVLLLLLLPPAIFGVLVAAETWSAIVQAYRDARNDAHDLEQLDRGWRP